MTEQYGTLPILKASRSSLLYYFYLSAYKVQQGFYKDISLSDRFPANLLFRGFLLFFQDLAAPFFFFLKSGYQVDYFYIDNSLSPEKIKLNSKASSFVLGRLSGSVNFELEIDKQGIRKLLVRKDNSEIDSLWEG
jgi:hypothetical protein